MQTQLSIPFFGDDRLPQRFWSKVRMLENGCWQWTAGHDQGGYGRFSVGSHRDATNRMTRAHRFAYEALAGPIPAGLECDHLCRNRACVYPAHIEPVTRSTNMSRSPLMRRDTRGSRHPGVKLTENQVLKIRRLRGRVSQRRLATHFEVSQATISAIWLRHRWQHL